MTRLVTNAVYDITVPVGNNDMMTRLMNLVMLSEGAFTQ